MNIEEMKCNMAKAIEDSKTLTPQQHLHNSRLDFEIMMANKQNERVKKYNKEQIERWNKFLKENPDYPFKACPTLDLSAPKRVIGIRYVSC